MLMLLILSPLSPCVLFAFDFAFTMLLGGDESVKGRSESALGIICGSTTDNDLFGLLGSALLDSLSPSSNGGRPLLLAFENTRPLFRLILPLII